MIYPISRIYHGGSSRRGSGGFGGGSQTTIFKQLNYTLADVIAMAASTLVVDNKNATLWTINWTASNPGDAIRIAVDSANCIAGKQLTIEFSRGYSLLPADTVSCIFDSYGGPIYCPIYAQEHDSSIQWNSILDREIILVPNLVEGVVVSCTFTFIYKSEYESIHSWGLMPVSVVRNRIMAEEPV